MSTWGVSISLLLAWLITSCSHTHSILNLRSILEHKWARSGHFLVVAYSWCDQWQPGRAFLCSVDGRPACGWHLHPQMAVLTHGVGVLPGHSHPHQQVGKGGHHQGGGGHCHHGDVVGGHRARLVVGGGHQHGPGGLQHNHSVDNFWWGWSAPHKSNQRQHVTIISKYSFCD